MQVMRQYLEVCIDITFIVPFMIEIKEELNYCRIMIQLNFCLVNFHLIKTQTSSTHGFAFIVQALVGVVLFNESLSLRWWMGASLIVLGLLLIHRANRKDSHEMHKVD